MNHLLHYISEEALFALGCGLLALTLGVFAFRVLAKIPPSIVSDFDNDPISGSWSEDTLN